MSMKPAVRDDPIEFIETFCLNRDGSPMKLHPTQKEFIQGMYTSKLCVGCCGRQWGKSVGLGGYGTWFASTKPNREIYIIAPTVDQSRIIFDEIAYQFRNTALSALVSGKIKEFPFPQIALKNGSRIHGRGANNPQFIRGKPLDLALLDEASFFKDGVIPNVIEPMLTVTGKKPFNGMVMVSTPFGMGDFYQYAETAQQSETAKFFRYTSLDNPHADIHRLDEIKNRYGEDSLLWQSEYMARFVDGDLAVFPWSSIKWACENYPYSTFPVAPLSGHRYVQGVDLANVRDYFVSSILDVSNPALNPLVRYDRFQKRGYTHYKNVVRNNYTAYNGARTLIDATSLGESVAEDLRDISAEGYKFSQQSKYEVVQELARMLSEHRLVIPQDRTIIDELRFFTYEITPSKSLKMEAKHGHDDIVMSLALSAHLACLPSFLGFFRGVDVAPIKSFSQPAPTTHNYYHDPIKEAFSLADSD